VQREAKRVAELASAAVMAAAMGGADTGEYPKIVVAQPVAGNGHRAQPDAGNGHRAQPVAGDGHRAQPDAGDGHRAQPVAGDGHHALPAQRTE
jgi:hypothetical protein